MVGASLAHNVLKGSGTRIGPGHKTLVKSVVTLVLKVQSSFDR